MSQKQEDNQNSKTKGLPKAAKIAIGCLVVLVILGVIFSLFAGVVAKKLIGGAISQKTGVQTNLDDIQNGKLSFTDPKTGVKLDVGTNKIPGDFPKDFPVYPGTKVTSSLSGNQNGQSGGFWLTLSTSDTPDKVTSFYETNLKTNGWSADSTTGTGMGTNWAVSKGNLSGYLTVSREKDDSETTILIVLGNTSSPTP